MKRIGNIWKDALDEDNALQALIDGTKFKRQERGVRKLLYDDGAVKKDPSSWHMIDPEKGLEYVRPIIRKLQNGTWRHAPPKYRRQYCRNRASSKGKWRDLYIPTLQDHVVAHMVMRASMDAFTRGMHPHCCGSVPGRGVRHIVETVSYWMQEDRQCRYFVKLDIRKYFDNINGEILKQKLRRKIKDKDVLQVHDQIIDSTKLLEGKIEDLHPGAKPPEEIACPVGYYTSPWYANLYLEELDWFVEQQLYKERRGKRIKYVRHYLRYVDDMLLIGTSKTDLEKAVREIKKRLRQTLGLEIKDCWEIKAIGKHIEIDGKRQMKPGTYWCDIGGYKFCKDGTILRDGIFLETRRLARRMHKQGYYTKHQCASINSRIGWSRKCDSRKFIENEIKPYVDIKTTRRIISNVDKESKRRKLEARRLREGRELRDSAEKLQTHRSDGRDTGAL